MTTTTLRRGGLGLLPPEVRPLIEPGSAAPGVLHLGLGAFHRAHQAVYTEAAMAAAGGDWGIIAVAPRSPGLVQALADQDCLYSVASRSAEGDRIRVVGSLAGVRHLPTQATEVLALLADPRIRVVTLTVTEKAYRIDDQVRADLATDRDPVTVPGLLGRGLRGRAAAGGPPLALVSCDNLPGNGARLRSLVGELLDGSVDGWVSFPATMVDRIVPAATDATRDRARLALGVADLAAVEAETFSQWVIQDAFPGGRPAWERAGAILTGDVTDWEHLKLRVLNGLHSTTAYLGALAGRTTIAETLTLPGLVEVLSRLVDDIAPTLTPPAGVRVEEYGREVLVRFANPAIEHRTRQIAMDGSQKLPQRLLHTMLDRRRLGQPAGLPALAVAAWMRYVAGTADDGTALPLDDPLAAELRAAVPATGDPARTVEALLGLEAVFPPPLRDDPGVVEALTHWLRALGSAGAAGTIAGLARTR